MGIRMNKKSFEDILIEEYMKILDIGKLRSYYHFSPYIQISKLRKEVRKELSISDTEFDKQFLEIKRETSQYLIHVTQPMLRGFGGVRINNKYYHYIGIFNKK